MSQLLPIPAVDVAGGSCTLPPRQAPGSVATQGTVLDAITAWRHQGAGWIHVTDLDRRAGTGDNLGAVHEALQRHKGHVRIQLDAGVADEDELEQALAIGVHRVIIDAGSVRDPDWLAGALVHHQNRVAAGIHAHDTAVVDRTGTVTGDLWELVTRLDSGGCPRFVIAEATGRGHWFHHDQHVLAGVRESVHHPVISDGGVRHLEDLHQLAKLGLEAAVIREPLHGRFTLAEAFAAVEPRFDPYEWGPARP